MIPDIDIWRCAVLMIKRFGVTADVEAAMRADQFLKDGQVDGQRLWMRIAAAIDALQKAAPGETKH